MALITTSLDDYMIDVDRPYWIATLEDGTSVLQDDDRPGLEPIAWFRLRDYCKESGLKIVSLAIRFRSHYEFSNDVEAAAFFRRGATGYFGTGKTQEFYILGSIGYDGILRTKKWQVPEIILEEETTRNIDGVEESIIWNTHHHQQV